VSAVDDASLAASLFAVDPWGLGGVCLRSLVQPARTQWLQILRDLLPPAIPLRRIPFNIADGRLLGGLDLTATLRANRPIAERGVLAATDGGVVVVTMAERLSPHTAACLDAVLDRGEIVLEREGVQISDPARVGVVALDESMADDERVPTGLLDRLALLVDLNGLDPRTPLLPLHDADEIVAARTLLPKVDVSPDLVAALCGTAMALGAGSVRVSILAVKAARVLAALEGRAQVSDEDAVTAGRLVFAPRATQVPQAESQTESQPDRDPAEDSGDPAEPPPTPPSPPPPTDADSGDAADSTETSTEERETPAADAAGLDERVLAAAQAAIPAGLLHSLRVERAAGRGPAGAAGRVGALRKGGTRGRPSGVRSGAPRGHARLNVLETLRAAAPWQRLRGRVDAGDVRSRVRIEPSDFRSTQYQQRSQTLTIFAVDASGSSALNRLAEAKGAVELLLADCYVRRDQVAVVTFRGRKAELLLPPTRSLVRAKRNLAGLPGGGGTPLAAAIDSALLLATQAARRGDTPLLVLLTDGRANVARDGAAGREAAHREALQAARQLGLARIATLFVDTSTRPNPLAQSIASAMNARYIALPYASAQALSSVVTAVASRARR
jgi:magnesium chelatase subunit D